MSLRALLLLAALTSPLGAQTPPFTVQDYLPLAVGNSWTYGHGYLDIRSTTIGDEVHHWEEVTISILRTEVIDDKTWYVFSDLPYAWPPKPPHFLAGKKLRWEGNHLMQHEGDAEIAIFQFDDIPTTDGRTHVLTERHTYSIPTTEGNSSVETYVSVTNGIPEQVFEMLPRPDHGVGRGIRAGRFGAAFGLISVFDLSRDVDYEVYENGVEAIRAVFRESETTGTDGTRDAGSSTHSLEYSYWHCVMLGYC